MEIAAYIEGVLNAAREASVDLAQASSAAKNAALLAMADRLLASADAIKSANADDVKAAEAAGLAKAMVDRLRVTDKRLAAMAQGLREVAALVDPVGEVIGGWVRPNGLRIEKVRVPIGVICMIYESRPNVTADAAGLCLKSGNACVLRGGKEALRSNLAIHAALAQGLEAAGLPEAAIQIINTPDRAAVDLLCQAEGRVDLIIPRGGEGLIRAVVEKARVPVIKHYKGVCHTYVDQGADLDLAVKVSLNAKVQYPAVCNAMECLLVHEAEAAAFLPRMAQGLKDAGCRIKGCAKTRALVPWAEAVTEADFDVEYNDLVLNVKVVSGLDEAVKHIARHGSKHSDAIITRDLERARTFAARVDSAAVFINTSTRCNDGGQFGFGAEIGISTDKLHARGPMAL
ncbi:MAG TPA: glutamate-5-semialdehyde dehydrogenase, partial [Candidatus Brocadiia bacterium]|nr:glutamate-5-semialdehyde dehydrogenase [Candidatus Brocadiia bacterium]